VLGVTSATDTRSMRKPLMLDLAGSKAKNRNEPGSFPGRNEYGSTSRCDDAPFASVYWILTVCSC